MRKLFTGDIVNSNVSKSEKIRNTSECIKDTINVLLVLYVDKTIYLSKHFNILENKMAYLKI